MAECHYCGRKFPYPLYELTVEDIQREHLPPAGFETACGQCTDRIRAMSHLIPDYSLRKTARDFAFMIPLFSGILFVAAIAISAVRVEGFTQLVLSSQWLGGAAAFFGVIMVWNGTKHRYGYTHSIRWSLNSKRVTRAFAIILAGIVVAVIASQLPG